MKKLEEYKAATSPLPEKMNVWHYYGKGLDSLKLEEAPVPQINPNQLLVRQDAVGLCFSDTKVIWLGPDHPRMTGRDFNSNPVTLGHEVSCTIVKVGDNLNDKYKIGQRFIIQADIFYHGVSMAYGYVIPGGLAEYSVIPEVMLEGDAGCYLLPLWESAGYVETALVEPWACVVSAYNQTHRDSIKQDGYLLVLAGKGAKDIDWSETISARNHPKLILVAGEKIALPRAEYLDSIDNWSDLKNQKTEGHGFDDIIVIGDAAYEDVENAAAVLADHSLMNFVGPHSFSRPLSLDIGRIHYNWHHYVGTGTNRVADGYQEKRSADITEGGLSWFIGAGGPMGQMHVQRAALHPRPPRRIVATDIDSSRMKALTDRLEGAAKERGVELIAINPNDMTPEEFDKRLRELSNGKGFDDVVSLVPVPALIEQAMNYLADGAWFNLFAGIARGTMGMLDINAIKFRKVRYIGSSGSALSDMQETLEKVHTGELSTNASLAAIGGMKTAKEGMAAVKNGKYPGKSLIFPLIPDLPLMSLPELKEKYPTVYAKLKDGKFWTYEAEDELLSLLAP
jgi:threonine dehydrogenase-like Zn-dependent dehydrogenase